MERICRIASIVLLFTAAAGSCAVSGQTTGTPDSQYAAAVAWTDYQIPEQKLSIALPKLPVARGDSDLCSQKEGRLYYAYARGVVYQFAWHAKSTQPIPDWCRIKKKFSVIADLSKRIDDLKVPGAVVEESDGTVAGKAAKGLRSTTVNGSVVETRWLVWLIDRWLELAITRRKETVVDEGRFMNGLKLSSSSGADVGSGADSMLGDADVNQQTAVEGKPIEGLVILSKPRPGYTDEARLHNVQGTVILRIVFLANGGIGPISVVKELPFGLTEQAINAAKKIPFLPKTEDGKSVGVTVTRQIEYTFSIY